MISRNSASRVLALLTLSVLLGCSGAGRNDSRAIAQRDTPLASQPPIPLTATIDTSGMGNTVSQAQSADFSTGTGRFVEAPATAPVPKVEDLGNMAALNFVNTPIEDVAKAVLGDLLHLNYTIDTQVQGGVTLETSQPVPRDALLKLFETTLRINNLALVEQNGVYRIAPLSAAPQANFLLRRAGDRAQAFGVEIVPLHYISASEIQKLLTPLLPQGAIVGADADRNLLIVAGTSDDRSAINDDVATFDVDWMQGMSFVLFHLQSAPASAVATELTQVMGRANGPVGSLVHIMPMPRLNAILAISPQERYLKDLTPWVEKLDQSQDATDRKIYVYHVQNGRASNLAESLSKVLGIATEQVSSPQSAANEGSAGSNATSSADLGGAIGSNGASDSMPPTNAELGAQLQSANGLAGPGSGGMSGNAGSGLRVVSNDDDNSLLIYATAKEYSVVEEALAQMDTPPQQVFIEAAIAEVTLTNDLQFGIQYAFKSGNHQIIQSSSTSLTPSVTLPGLAYIFSSGTNIQATLNALDDITKVKVVSAPEVLVLNNQTAQIQVGDEVPVATQSAVSVSTAGAPVVNSIEFQNTGVILKVTPRINEGGLVLMDLSQEVSDVIPTTSSSLDSPTIEERKVSSTIAVQDGQTIALGGLIQDSNTHENSGVPYLENIPYLGALFRNSVRNKERTELLILLTPHVVQGPAQLRTATSELRQTMSETEPLFDQLH